MLQLKYPTIELPPLGQLIVWVSTIICVVLYCILNLTNVHPSSSKFLVYELSKQYLLVFIVIQFIGFMYYIDFSYIPSKPLFFVPVVLAIVCYTMTVTMGYAQTSNCKKPKRQIIFINALKPVIAVWITFYLVTQFSFFRQGFYDLINKGQHSTMGWWTAIAFWCSGIILPSLSSAYFSIQEHSCNSKHTINVRNLYNQDNQDTEKLSDSEEEKETM